MVKRYFLLLFVFFSFISAKSQTYHDIGFIVGNTYFKSDYGERNDFQNFYANNGFTVGILYYIGFDTGRTDNWKNYFKVRTEAMFMKSDLQHYGQWADPAKTNVFATQLRAMRGTTSVANLGFQVEYFPFMTDDYNKGIRFAPYISLGFQLNGYSSTATSTLGSLGNSVTTPVKYLSGFRNESGFTTSFSLGGGTRYKLSDNHSLFADIRLLRYNSDWVDGLNPDRNIYTENESNDYQFTLSFGYIYLLD